MSSVNATCNCTGKSSFYPPFYFFEESKVFSKTTGMNIWSSNNLSGFRFGVRQIAEGFSVAGYASNLPDGRVEVFLQGDREEVEAMEKEIGESHLAGFIREATGREAETESGRRGFQIL